MKEYIDKEVFCKNRYLCIRTHCDKEKCSEFAPAADVVEVVHAKWQKSDMFNDMPECSACFSVNGIERNYCPNCGAKMDGGKADA